MSQHTPKQKNVTVPQLRAMKARGERITMITAYDALFARLLDQTADILLVGDSLGMVVQGHDTTLRVTLEDVIYHTQAVARGSTRAHVVADMPFMSYQADPLDAVRNAGRLVKEGGAHAVKLEGGHEVAEAVRRIVACGVPVMGHLGLTPQSVHAMGGFKVQGRCGEDAERILDDARCLEAAGVYAMVLEGIPVELSRIITAAVSVPTIGIGAGLDCDGQVLVLQDLLGLTQDFQPKFVKRFAELGEMVKEAAARFSDEVKDGAFPGEEHTFHTKEPLFTPRRANQARAV